MPWKKFALAAKRETSGVWAKKGDAHTATRIVWRLPREDVGPLG